MDVIFIPGEGSHEHPPLSCGAAADCRLNSALLVAARRGKQMGNKVTADVPRTSTDKLQMRQLC